MEATIIATLPPEASETPIFVSSALTISDPKSENFPIIQNNVPKTRVRGEMSYGQAIQAAVEFAEQNGCQLTFEYFGRWILTHNADKTIVSSWKRTLASNLSRRFSYDRRNGVYKPKSKSESLNFNSSITENPLA
ncbi:hypothetical protein HK096_008965, partial [Nowakowskiella sp. JEL0078]